MKAEDYLITTTRGSRSRKLVWNGQKPLPLDHPVYWVLEKTPKGIQARDVAGSHRREKSITLTGGRIARGPSLALFIPDSSGKPKTLNVTIVPLKRIKPAYAPLSEPDNAVVPVSGARFYLFRGVKQYLVRFERLHSVYRAFVEKRLVFSVARNQEGYLLKAYSDGVMLESGSGKKRIFGVEEPELLDERQLLSGTLRWQQHWWRINRIIVPEDPSDVGVEKLPTRETTFLWRTGRRVAATLVSLLFILYLFPKSRLEQPSFPTRVTLKQPKRIARSQPAKMVRIQPPKIAHKKVAPPRPAAPARRGVVKKPAPKAKAAPIAKTRPLAPTVAPPSPAQERARAQEALKRSLSFLSPSLKRPIPSNELAKLSEKERAKYETDLKSLTATKPSDSTQLRNLANTSTGPQETIDTMAARNIRADVSAPQGSPGGMAGGKALNEVQGRVSLHALYDPNAKGGGDGFGSALDGRRIAISGEGSIAESVIEKILAKNLAKFQYCYEKALLADPGLAGNIVMQWTIEGNGGTTNVKVVKSQLGNSGLHSCLARELTHIKFPSPSGGAVIIKFPFSFSSSTI